MFHFANTPVSHIAPAHSGPAHIADILSDLRTDELDLLAELAAEQEAAMRAEWLPESEVDADIWL